MKRLQRFDEKREEWVSNCKKNHNVASIKDEAVVMVCTVLYMILKFSDDIVRMWGGGRTHMQTFKANK